MHSGTEKLVLIITMVNKLSAIETFIIFNRCALVLIYWKV